MRLQVFGLFVGIRDKSRRGTETEDAFGALHLCPSLNVVGLTNLLYNVLGCLRQIILLQVHSGLLPERTDIFPGYRSPKYEE